MSKLETLRNEDQNGIKYSSEQLIQCHQRIVPYIHNTPILTSESINEIVEANLYFKCENFQKTGAFKMRGAVNAILQLTEKQKKKGVVTHSSGNFAQALALAAKYTSVRAFIVMPSTALQIKKEAVLRYGGNIIECENTLQARVETADQIVKDRNATFVHPSNNINVVLGQGTACMELLEIHPDLEFVFTPVGGGGLVAGTALSALHFGKECKVIGGEPFEVDDAFRSLISGVIESNISTETIADGLRTKLGDMTFPIIQQYVDRIIRVTEEEIVKAMRLIWERMKIIIEPSSAVAVAALIREKQSFKNKKIGIIISGGNVDLNNLPF